MKKTKLVGFNMKLIFDKLFLDKFLFILMLIQISSIFPEKKTSNEIIKNSIKGCRGTRIGVLILKKLFLSSWRANFTIWALGVYFRGVWLALFQIGKHVLRFRMLTRPNSNRNLVGSTRFTPGTFNSYIVHKWSTL